MPKFAANLTMLFTEAPFLDRFKLAAQHGFKAVEFLFPYDYKVEEIRHRLEEYGLELVLHNLPAGDWSSGERGIACLRDRQDEFRHGVHLGVRYAQELRVRQLNCLVGITPRNDPERVIHAALVENLRYAADRLADAGLDLLVEPINGFDIPNFHLNTPQAALMLFDEVDRENVFLQFDVYHVQRTTGELAAQLQRYLPRIRHVQIADNPGRGEPGTGEINFPFLFECLDRIGYTGWVGCEYKPTVPSERSLTWRPLAL